MENELKIITYDEDKMQTIISDIGENIRLERKKLDVSAAELCHRANLSESQLYKIETGMSKIGLLTLLKVSAGLNIPTGLLIPSIIDHVDPDYNIKLFQEMTKGLSQDKVNLLLNMIKTWIKYSG
jgi:transcriptional regulator with XRE-family HTH domain